MHEEMIRMLRLNALAQMAATLSAGDRARSDVPHGDPRTESERAYAIRAIELYEAVEAREYPLVAVLAGGETGERNDE